MDFFSSISCFCFIASWVARLFINLPILTEIWLGISKLDVIFPTIAVLEIIFLIRLLLLCGKLVPKHLVLLSNT